MFRVVIDAAPLRGRDDLERRAELLLFEQRGEAEHGDRGAIVRVRPLEEVPATLVDDGLEATFDACQFVVEHLREGRRSAARGGGARAHLPAPRATSGVVGRGHSGTVELLMCGWTDSLSTTTSTGNPRRSVASATKTGKLRESASCANLTSRSTSEEWWSAPRATEPNTRI